MVATSDRPKTERKRSKKPLYARAFDLYCDGLELPEIARRLSLPIGPLTDAATSQRWAHRRGRIGDATSLAAVENRIVIQSQVDSTLCRATQSAADLLAISYTNLIRSITELPIDEAEHEAQAAHDSPTSIDHAEPFDQGVAGPNTPKDAAKPRNSTFTSTSGERYRQRCHMIERKIQLQKAATEGLREMIQTAQAVGLLRVERKGGTTTADDDKPIDLSKLTQLNIAIVQATGKQPAQVLAQLGNGGNAGGQDAVNVTPSG